jgi:DNA adenine methylase
MTVPILRWAGSKKKLLPTLMAAAPENYLRYVEPFAGSAVLYLRLDDTPALLGDINTDLIDTYETVRQHPKRVWSKVAAMSTKPDFYYELRAQDASRLGKLDRAARFVYLNRFCFNGVYRTNRQGQFNVSRGKGHLFVPEFEVFSSFADKLANASLFCGDFEAVVAQAGQGDFLYLDPPYSLEGKRDRGEYGLGTFREKDEDRLFDAVTQASDRGAQVLLSYSPSRRMLKRLPGWKVKRLDVARNVAGFTSARRTAKEVLVSNYDWPLASHTQ